MSYLSPVDSAQVYFQPIDVDDDAPPSCGEDRDRFDDRRPETARGDRRSDRLEDMRERFEDFRDDGGRERLRIRDVDGDDWRRDHDDRCDDRDGSVRFERYERARIEDTQTRPLPRL